jgi:hypothetical protein
MKYFGARYYHATSARWISADSLTARVYDPQSLNKYGYVRNDPVNLVDPDGQLAAVVALWKSWWFYDPPSFSVGPWTSGRAEQARGPAGSGGVGSVGPTIVTHSWLVDWFPSFFNIDTSISAATRQQVLAGALAELGNRIEREDCKAFLQGVIDKLRANGVLKEQISNPADLVTYGLNKSTIYLYGAQYNPDRLGKGSPAAARVVGMRIYLGEWFYSGILYKAEGGDQVSTIIHELGHLDLVAAAGKSLTDLEFSRYLGYDSSDDWGRLVRTNCGPK